MRRPQKDEKPPRRLSRRRVKQQMLLWLLIAFLLILIGKMLHWLLSLDGLILSLVLLLVIWVVMWAAIDPSWKPLWSWARTQWKKKPALTRLQRRSFRRRARIASRAASMRRIKRRFPEQYQEFEHVFRDLDEFSGRELRKGKSRRSVQLRYLWNCTYTWGAFWRAVTLGSVRQVLSRRLK